MIQRSCNYLNDMFGKLISKYFSKEIFFYHDFVDNCFIRNLEEDILYYKTLHPESDFERSIAQHKCQIRPFRKKVLFFDLVGFFMMPFAIGALLIKRKTRVKDERSVIACYKCLNLPGSLPEVFRNKDIIYIDNNDNSCYLNWKDAIFLLKFYFRSLFYPFLAFRMTLKVARYRAIIDAYPCLDAIAITGEFEPTSSALTLYCHENGVRHLDFMQGDAFRTPRESFFHFDKCYVWDQLYADGYISFGACPEQFEVSIPSCLQKIECAHIVKNVDYTYFLGDESYDLLKVIRTALDNLIRRGFICEVRPHPRWANSEQIKDVFRGITIQDTSHITVNDSILRTRNAVSLYSTVLLQSYFNGVNVVIDDCTCPDNFRRLESLHYIMLSKPHTLLSQLLNEEENN